MRHGLRAGFAACLLGLLVACDGGPTVEPLAADATILAFGDSLTAGTGAKRDQAYPTQLDAMLSQRVINAGVPGETTAGGLQRLPGVLSQHNPALVVLCLGGNDMLRKLDRGQAKANLAAMIRMIRERGAQVVLLGVPEPGLLLLSAPAFYAELAEEFGLPYDGETLPNILADRSLKSDPIHPNAEGYRELAGAVRTLLAEAGAID